VKARRSAGRATDREITVVAAVLVAGSEKAAAHRRGPGSPTVATARRSGAVNPHVATKTTAPATAPTWRNRITGSGQEAPDQLLANPANWRVHPRAQQDALAGALDAVGWVQQVLVNQRTGFVVDGHARVALALRHDEATVPVLHVDLEPAEEALVLATLDPISAMAGRDEDKLRALLAGISVDDAGLRGPSTACRPSTGMSRRTARGR